MSVLTHWAELILKKPSVRGQLLNAAVYFLSSWQKWVACSLNTFAASLSFYCSLDFVCTWDRTVSMFVLLTLLQKVLANAVILTFNEYRLPDLTYLWIYPNSVREGAKDWPESAYTWFPLSFSFNQLCTLFAFVYLNSIKETLSEFIQPFLALTKKGRGFRHVADPT